MATVSYVPSPPPRPPRYGLVAAVGGEAAIARFMASAEGMSEGGPERWADGFQYQPFNCSSATTAFRLDCAATLSFSESAIPETQTFNPYGIWDGVKCSTLTNNLPDLTERARQKLLTSTSFKVEAEFWKGTLAQTAGGPSGNSYLNKTAGLTQIEDGVAVPGPYALALLAKAIGECEQGARAMIHVTTETATLWLGWNVIRKENGLLLDGMDNIIVAGTGYDGSGPGGTVDASTDTSWAYATSMVDVRLGSIEVHAATQQGDNVNDVIAWRPAAATHDGCCRIGVNVNLCQPYCAPG